MDDVLVVLTLVTALGCGLSAGALFAFTSFVMGALARLQPAQGIAAMNSMTMAYHVPRNNALAGVEPTNDDAEAHWRRYVAEWTRWNHVRVAAGILAAAALTVALHVD